MSKIYDIFLFIYFFFVDKSPNLSKIVLVLVAASVKRFFVSHMQNFFNITQQKKLLLFFFFKTKCKNVPGVAGAVLQTGTD